MSPAEDVRLETLRHLAAGACEQGGGEGRGADDGPWCSVHCGLEVRSAVALVRLGLAESEQRQYRNVRRAISIPAWVELNTYPVFKITEAGRAALKDVARKGQVIREGS